MAKPKKRGPADQSSRKQATGKRARSERVTAMRARQQRAERRRNLLTIGALAAVVVIVAGGIAWYAAGRGGNTAKSGEVIPATPAGTAETQAAPLTVPNTSGIPGVAAYVTTGWPTSSNNGPANRALGHTHVTGPVTYAVTPPVGGDHNPVWLSCGIYNKPVPNEYAVHDLEHGVIWITYQPSLPQSEVSQLRAFVEKQSMLSPAAGIPSARYMTLTPYPGLPSPVVASSWGFQLRLNSPTDPRLQQFVSKFRVSPKYTPEYGAQCTQGAGTPASS